MRSSRMTPTEVFANWKASGDGDEELIAYMDELLIWAEAADRERDELLREKEAIIAKLEVTP